MSETNPTMKHWAILIGINFYVKGDSLKGCVRDVENIEQYLAAVSTPVDVKSFTASAPSDSNSRHPTEPSDRWPTYENVTSGIKTITVDAERGDLVYLHYSGHGAQMKATASGYSNKNTGDLALVLFNDDDVLGRRYLRGLELAYLIHRMVEKGLLVTIVLDCCFSGSVVRYGHPHHGAGVRATDYDHAVDIAYPQEFGMIYGFQFDSLTLRDAHILPTWLVSPSGYTILTACGPHEKAKELEFKGGERSGVLTYFLFCALQSMWKGGVEITHQSLYQHLCARFHASWPQQTPMRYGNKGLSFFGKLTSGTDSTFISVTQRDDCLRLEAGHGHGVCMDDEYALYPFVSSESVSSNTSQAPVKARVGTVRGLTSDLVVVDSALNQSHVKAGWKARLLTSLSSHKVLIKIPAHEDHQTQWRAPASQRRFLNLFSGDDKEGQPFLFNVIRNGRNEYEILNESHQKIISLPTIPLGRTGAWNCVVKVLEHLATFKYFEGIENRSPSASFENSFELYLGDAVGSNMEVAGILDVKHESELSLTFRNLSDIPLYLAIFDLGPLWQIDSLLCSSGGGDFKVVPPKHDGKGDSGKAEHSGKTEIRWSMNVPESFRNLDQCQCEDVLKVFVTSKSTSFAAVMLPKISKSAEALYGSMRGGGYDQLSQFLSELKALRGTKDDPSDEEWIARNFLIRTTVAEMANT